MKSFRVYQVLAFLFIILVSVQAKSHRRPTSSAKQQYLKESPNQDEIARQMFIGMAKSFGVTLSQSSIQAVTYENWKIEELETALNNFGAVMIDQSYLKETVSSIRNIFAHFGTTLPNTEGTDKIINYFLRVFSDESTFNQLKAKLYEDKSIDCQLYLWGALDYIIFDQYQVVGETFGKVVFLMSKYLQ